MFTNTFFVVARLVQEATSILCSPSSITKLTFLPNVFGESKLKKTSGTAHTIFEPGRGMHKYMLNKLAAYR